jgi:hypothetical protein
MPDPEYDGRWIRLECDPAAELYRAMDTDGIDVSERVARVRNALQ